MFFRTCACLKNLKALQAVPGASDANVPYFLCSKPFHRGERMSRCTLFGKRASLTVEAALVFPLFLFAVTAFMYLFLLLQLQTEVGRVLTDAGKELAQSEELLNIEEREAASGISMGYAKYSLEDYLKERAAGRIIKGGFRGISVLGCEFSRQDSVLTLRAAYQVTLPPGLLWFRPLTICQSRSVRCWVGFENRRTQGEDGEEVVYVTDYGTVYHRSLECRHLKLSIRQVSVREAGELRNGSGGKYYPCERCRKHESGFVYITEEGNRYHESLGCSGLSRKIRTLPISQAGGRPPCSVCGGG